MKRKFILVLILSCLFIILYAQKTKSPLAKVNTVSASNMQEQAFRNTIKFIDSANMDFSIKPGDNFYVYANGNWLKKNLVPASETRWGSIDVLTVESNKRMKSLLEEAAKNRNKDRLLQMVGDFYTSGMDSVAIEKIGYQPIKAHLIRVAALKNKQQIILELAAIRTKAVASPLFGFSVVRDRKNATAYIPQLTQGGITLPERDYYLKEDVRMDTIRRAYRNYIGKMFVLVGKNPTTAAQNADAVMRIETALAKSHLSRVERRDYYKTYNKFSVKDFEKQTHLFKWSALLPEMKLTGADTLLVDNPKFFTTADSIVNSLPLHDWKAYLQWNIINNASPYLSSNFVDEHFRFNRVLTGQKVQKPRWEQISELADQYLGDVLGQLYVEKYFRPEAKERALDLINNLQQTFAERLHRLDWMSDATKQQALYKLASLTKKIGFPDQWKEYSGLIISSDIFFENLQKAKIWTYNNRVNRFGQTVNKLEWELTPPTIEASYSAVNNDIVFPAGILQFPFFDLEADDAVNYGAIGVVIGHEIIHGFDDRGSKYNAMGNLKNWWTEEDAEKFKQKTELLVDQYNLFKVLDSMHVNGKLTLAENISDLGGLNLAYEAFTKTKQFREGRLIDGFTPAQRFFLSFAQILRENKLDETAAEEILTDPHSPNMYRVNGIIMHLDAWYNAFNVKPGDKMYVAPEKRIRIW